VQSYVLVGEVGLGEPETHRVYVLGSTCFFEISRSYSKILGTRRVTCIKVQLILQLVLVILVAIP